MEVSPETRDNIARIADIVKKQRCILFLGAMASAPSPPGAPYPYRHCPPGGGKLSQDLAEESGYPEQDRWNLLRVALHYEKIFASRSDLVDAIKRHISGKEQEIQGQPSWQPFQPSPALEMLAALPFPIIITTNYDRLFDQALRRARTTAGSYKDPLVRIYHPDQAPEPVPLDPSEDKPILFKLHGDIEHPATIVVTEEDYLHFIHRMSDKYRYPIHDYLRARIGSWPVLFIGYSLQDFNLRLLFRTLRWTIAEAAFPHSYSIDPSPDQLIVSVFDGMVSFIQDDLWNFVPALYEAVLGHPYAP